MCFSINYSNLWVSKLCFSLLLVVFVDTTCLNHIFGIKFSETHICEHVFQWSQFLLRHTKLHGVVLFCWFAVSGSSSWIEHYFPPIIKTKHPRSSTSRFVLPFNMYTVAGNRHSCLRQHTFFRTDLLNSEIDTRYKGQQ